MSVKLGALRRPQSTSGSQMRKSMGLGKGKALSSRGKGMET